MVIKDRSVKHFMMDNLIGFDLDEYRLSRNPNNYYFMKNEFHLKKKIFETDSVFYFELEDFSLNTRKKLKNVYTYIAYPYDDISVRLVLTESHVEVVSSQDDLIIDPVETNKSCDIPQNLPF